MLTLWLLFYPITQKHCRGEAIRTPNPTGRRGNAAGLVARARCVMNRNTTAKEQHVRKYSICITTEQQTAKATCLAPSAQAADAIAWQLAERLLGNVPPLRVSVKPA